MAGWFVGQGFPFLAVFLLGMSCYVGGGLVYARRVQKSTTVGWMAHPHATYWKEALSLVVDGTSFVGSKKSRSVRSSRHSETDSSSGGKYERIDEEAAPVGKDKRSKQKKQKGDPDQKKKKEKETRKSSSSTSRKEKGSSSRKDSGSSRQDQSGVQDAPAGTENLTDAEQQRMLQERVELDGNLHQSQAKIKVVGLNESAEM